MSVPRTLYRQLLVGVRRMQQQGVPCTGCVGLPAASGVLCPAALIGHAFRRPHQDGSSAVNDAFYVMRMLPRQLAVLQQCEEETRQALQQWQHLQQQWCRRAPLTLLQQAEAAEAAAWLLQRLVTQQAQQQLLMEEEAQELQQQCEASIQAAQQQLDSLAAAVRAAAPDVFQPAADDAGAAGNKRRMQQLDVLRLVLFQQHKLRCDPFEWVYDGLAPLVLPQVLQRRKGVPLSLVLVAAGVGRRLGLQLRLLCAEETQAPGTASGPLIVQQLPPEVAARQAGRTLAAAPPPDTWLLQLQHCQGQPWGAEDAVLLDVSARGGQLLNAAACVARFPHMAGRLARSDATGQEASTGIEAAWQAPSSVISVWANMARTMVLAHQRRGESDLVAHWLYQLLALDSRAEEWTHVMQE